MALNKTILKKIAEKTKDDKPSAMERIAAFIVDKRKAFYLLYIGFAIFCVFSGNWVRVNDDLHQFGGIGNGEFIAGDMNVYGRCYIATVGLGIAYCDKNEK